MQVLKDTEPKYPRCKTDPDFHDVATLSVIDSLSNFTCRFHPGKPPQHPDNRACLDFTANGNANTVNNEVDEVWTVFVVHGFMSSLNADWELPLRDSFVQRYAKKSRRVVGIAVGWGKDGKDNIFAINVKLIISVMLFVNFSELFFPPKDSEIATYDTEIDPYDTTLLLPNWVYCAERIMPKANYPRMSTTTAVIGHILGGVDRVVASTSKNNGQKRKTFCVGHSLGAQVCGFMGKSTRSEDLKPVLDGIIGIDPAGPIFEVNSEDNKLWRGDAKVRTLKNTKISLTELSIRIYCITL